MHARNILFNLRGLFYFVGLYQTLVIHQLSAQTTSLLLKATTESSNTNTMWKVIAMGSRLEEKLNVIESLLTIFH